MLDSILTLAPGSLTVTTLICLAASLVLGVVIAVVYMYRNIYSKSFVITLALLPAMVQAVILMVNGNLGVGVAVMGAFSLVRFRSIPGSASEITSIFFAMAVGLATGMGFIGYAVIFTVVISVVMLLYSVVRFGEGNQSQRTLRIVIPEDLDYTGLFDDLFSEFTKKATLERVQTTNLGSLYELRYTITLTDPKREKELIDKIRQRNGNLNISCTRVATGKEEL
ncbi:DUF4956 domain-containing protein [Breznakiella homolactica]|uniref:DUF4956 domain-containing protein n=1 Tax=Breznakiella homolactica TaxID=2798577 RepID=A0A7T8BAD3_9SPIR|nr:DUF4956 domain-containing protein [Breznakiella homolactica]QQO09407.1 DUF4956 domain-containing protein [Breznakiella homolactica]